MTLAVTAAALAESAVTDEIAVIVSAGLSEHAGVAAPEQREWIARIYGSGDGGAVWFSASGARPAAGRRAALPRAGRQTEPPQ